MDLTTATPTEIDTALVTAYNTRKRAEISRERAVSTVKHIEDTSERERQYYSWCSPEALKAAQVEIDACDSTISRLDVEIATYNEEFDSRGGWTRYFLVTNSNGHVHSSTHCSSCFPTTQYAWLTEQSGMTPEALVELAGESACTECFPWAPVSTLRRPSTLEAPERKAARLVREAEKAARLAKKIEKALTEDGSEFEITTGSGRWDKERFKTEQAASQWVVGVLADHRYYAYSYDLSEQKEDAITEVIRAIALKHGIPFEEAEAEIDRKVKAKVKRDSRNY